MEVVDIQITIEGGCFRIALETKIEFRSTFENKV